MTENIFNDKRHEVPAYFSPMLCAGKKKAIRKQGLQDQKHI
ncbi:hypothetical protein [Draconibacterium orientale]|nr:hypothetical protein [Draconibacterium orientale]